MANRHIDPILLSSYIDGELQDKQKREIEQHLSGCADCRAQLEELKAVSVPLKAWQVPEPSWDFDNRVRHKIVVSDLERGRVKMRKPLWVIIPSGAVAGLLVLVMVSSLVRRGLEGRVREATVGDKFAELEKTFNGDLQYEPYYDEGSNFTTTRNAKMSEQLQIGGGVVRDISQYTQRTGNQVFVNYEDQLSRLEMANNGAPVATPVSESWEDGKALAEAPTGSVIVIAPYLPATSESEKIIRTANIRIEVEDGQAVYGKLTALCQEEGGYLSGSQLSADEDGRISGHVTMRVPQAKFLETLEKVRGLGSVKVFMTNSQDVSRDYRNLKERLDAAKVVYDKMLKALQDRKNTVEEAIRTESELTPVLGRIQWLKDQIDVLENAVSYTTITVAFNEPEVSERLVAASGQHIRRALMASKISFIKSFAKALPHLVGFILMVLVVLGVGIGIVRLVTRKNKTE